MFIWMEAWSFAVISLFVQELQTTPEIEAHKQ